MTRFVKPAVRMLLASGVAFALPAVANAAAIVGLFNTGVDNSGIALVGGAGVVDPHYKIVATTDPTATVGNNGVTYFNSAYLAENANSRWIATTAAGGGGGITIFELTFDLTGYDPSTASLSGKFAADNQAYVALNGSPYPFFGVGGYSSLESFSFSSYFVSGLNKLRFELRDFGVPGALRVDQLSGTANLAAPGVPEPATWGMMMLGFGLIGSAMRRRRVVASFA